MATGDDTACRNSILREGKKTGKHRQRVAKTIGTGDEDGFIETRYFPDDGGGRGEGGHDRRV